MRRKILLINPWIYDFAAFNFWVRPLGILKVAEHLSAYDVELSFIDCMDSFEVKRYGTGRFKTEQVEKPHILKDILRLYKRYGISIAEFVERLNACSPVDAVMLTCIMSYWYPGVQKAVEIMREILGSVPVVLGGIYATLYTEHACENSGADFAHKGKIARIDSALYDLGIKIKRKRDRVPYYRLNLYNKYPFAPLLTSEGCPFRCPYCASGLLTDRYHGLPNSEVLKEVKELSGIGVRDYAFYDDALLFEPENHIKPILRGLIEEGLNARFHCPNGLHARFIDEETAALMKAANFRTIRLGLETVNPERQEAAGAKVNNKDIEEAVRLLKKKGFSKKEIGVYIMYGLPGEDIEELKDGINFLKSLDVRIHLTEFSPIRGTRSWNELMQMGLINDKLDPLLTNNTIFSYLYSGYDTDEIYKIKIDVKKFNAG
jgi:radical SAM superfamily enzyme YgiQ (UPF0313 family)